MPWKETCTVDLRLRFVMEHEVSEIPMAVLCRRYSISRKTAYKWVGRYRRDRLEGLSDRSRAPHHHPNHVADDITQAVIAARLAHPTGGPKKLRVILGREAPQRRWPAVSTMAEILKRHGLVRPRKRRRRTPPYTEPFAEATDPNAVWCVDFKGWFRTADGARCDPLTITDAYSRYLLDCRAVMETDTDAVRAAMERTFRQKGLPWAIRTDNGPPFASRARCGLSRLSVWWLKLGIVPERIAPGHPEQNGRHERMHLTLKGETASPPAGTRIGQQRRFNRFRREFNVDRPHEALEMRTPASQYHRSSRPYPRGGPQWEYPCGMTLRRVYDGGRFRWHSEGVFLTHALTGELVGLCPLDDRYWQVWVGPLELGVLDSHHRVMLTERERNKLVSEETLVCPSSFRSAPETRADDQTESVTHVPG